MGLTLAADVIHLTKFQDCLPEVFALEVVENYLLDVEGTVRWLGSLGARQSAREAMAGR